MPSPPTSNSNSPRRTTTSRNNNNNNNGNGNGNSHSSYQPQPQLSLRRILAAAGTATVVGLGMVAIFDFLDSRNSNRESRLETFGRGLGEIVGVDIGRPGLSEREIERLPTRVMRVVGSASKEEQRGGREEDKCAICQSEYEDGERLRVLPCLHEFHAECLNAWVGGHRDCPVCRSEIDVSSGGG